jgi:allantoin racemase
MRILLINPNTTEAVTERMVAAAIRVASPGTGIGSATAAFGARIIGSRVETAVAGAAVLEGLARHAAGYDAVIVAASVDPGLAAAREMLDVPVAGITEAALHAACLLGGLTGAVVIGAHSGTILREMAAGYGLDRRIGAVRTLLVPPVALLADLAGAARAIEAAAQEMVANDGVDTIVLIGAVMAGLPAVVQPGVPVPVLEGVSAAVALAEGLVRLRPPPAGAGSYAAPPDERVAAAVGSLRRGVADLSGE